MGSFAVPYEVPLFVIEQISHHNRPSLEFARSVSLSLDIKKSLYIFLGLLVATSVNFENDFFFTEVEKWE